MQVKPLYNEFGRLNVNFQDKNELNELSPIIECGDECNCSGKSCSNRVVQNGCRFNLEVFECEIKAKGFGLLTKEKIPAGSFVIEYLGEILNQETAEQFFQQRQAKNEPNYIMILKECYLHNNSFRTTIIDARNYSNKSRFINHGCEPNLIVIPVRFNNEVAHAALFSTRDIEAMEELCYDYNGSLGTFDSKSEVKKSSVKCLCGSKWCKVFLADSS